MPYFGGEMSAPSTTMTYTSAAPDPEMLRDTAENTMAKDSGNPWINTMMTVGLAPLDLADTLYTSTVGRIAGTERGQINEGVLRTLGVSGLSNFYDQHKDGVETASGIGGIVAAELVTRKFTKPAGVVMKTIRTLPYARRLAALDEQAYLAKAAINAADSSLAARGAIGVEQYAGRVTVDTMRFDAKTNAFVGQTLDTTRDKLLFNSKVASAKVGMRHAAFVEVTSAVTLNQNDFLYSDNMAQNIAWQAFGVGIGGAAEWFHAAYSARKFVNSDEIRRTFANAYDPEGKEAARLLWHGKKVPTGQEFESFLGGKYTDRITSLLSSANDLKSMPVQTAQNGRELLANRSRMATQHLADAREEVQKVVTKGISSDGYTRFDMRAEGYGNHIDMVMYRDPTGLYGVEQMGAVYADKNGVMKMATEIHQTHMNRLSERINAIEDALDNPINLGPDELADLQALRKRLDFEMRLTPQVLIDGERVPLSEAAGIEGFVEPKVTKTVGAKGSAGLGSEDASAMSEARSHDGSRTASIDSDFTIHTTGAKDLDVGADHFDMLRLYRAADPMIDHLAKWKGAIPMPAKPNWFQLDMAEEIMRRNDAAKIVWPQGMTRESAQVESLVQKAEAIKKWKIDKLHKQAGKNPNQWVDAESELSKLRVRFNLPKLTAYERGLTGESAHPVERLLRGIEALGADKVRGMGLQEIKEAVAQFKRLGDNLSTASADDVASLTGNSFKYMMDEFGQPVKPILLYSRPFKEISYTADDLADRLAARKIMVAGKMGGQDSALLTRTLTESVLTSSDTQLASQTHTLMDSQIQGGILGAAPQTLLGGLTNAVKTSEWIARDNPTILAAARVRDTVERVTRDTMKAVVDNAFGGTLDYLKNPRNSASSLLLNQFHSVRGGWDLEAKVKTLADGNHTFTLSDTVGNRQRWKQIFGADMPKGQTLVDHQGRQVVLDDLALDIQKRYNSVTDQLIAEKNSILRAQGLPEIDRVKWYAPPPNTNGKLIGIVFDPTNKPVPGMGVVASTPAEFEKLKAALTPKLDQLGIGYVFRTQDEIKDFASIWDRVAMDMINPGRTPIQPGKVSKGILSGSEVKLNAFDESLQYVRDGYMSHANDVIETLFKEQINASKARSSLASVETRNAAMPFGSQKYKNIYDIYLETLLGRNKLKSSGSAVGPLYNFVEGMIDKVFESSAPTASMLWDLTNGWINKMPWSKTQTASREFDKLSQALGQYMPFADAAALMEAKGLGAKPWTAKEMTAKLNAFTAGVTLRVFEVAHPLMNMAGMINSMPAVIRNYALKDGEDVADYAKRVGHSALIFNLPNGQKIGTLDMAKLGARAFKRAWNASSHADYQYMVKRGYLSQEVAEFHRQFGSIESKSSWQKFFHGDDTIKNPRTVSEHLRKKGLVGWASVLSDKSEDLSRSWGHMMGLELADNLGITKLADRHSFAHDIANKMIANYSPHNRPEIFQGALGANLGLFQSFIQNYYQRMFRYIETKDYKSLVNQYVAQGAMFGVTTVPGFKAFSDFMSQFDDDHADAETNLRSQFGENAANLIANGTLSNIPTLFGLEGVDLWSRGDTTARLPVTQMPAGLATIGKLANGMAEGVMAFWNNSGELTPTRIAEIASNMIPNRPIAGMIEQLGTHGMDIDRHGQVVSETRGAMEATYRVMGLRSQRQSNELSQFYADKTMQAHQAAAKDILRLATRAAIRDGREDVLPIIYQKYVENGGDERHFNRWLEQQIDAATSTRAERRLKRILDDPKQMEQVARYLDSGVSIEEDEKTPELSTLYGSDGSEVADPLNQSVGGLGKYGGQMTVDNALSEQ